MQPKRIILLAALIALVAKLYCAGTTTGTNDTVFFYGFGKRINENGLAHTYKTVTIFNHTPLVGYYSALLQRIEPGTQMKMELLPFLLRLPGIIADFLAVFVLFRIRAITGGPPWWAIGVFVLSPVAFMVSGFHGNVDSVLALLLLVAAWLALENKPALCGVALGLACNVKVAPLLLGPVFAAWWWYRGAWRPRSVIRLAALLLLSFCVLCFGLLWRLHVGDTADVLSADGIVYLSVLLLYPVVAICLWRSGGIGSFLLCALLVTLAGWSSALFGAPREFLGNVLGYQGYWGIWGVSWCLKQTGADVFQKVGFEQLTSAQMLVMAVCKWGIIAGVIVISWLRRKADALGLFTTLAWVWALFFVCAAGVAPQYFVWLAPFLLVATPRWSAAVTAAASVFLFVFYNVTANVRTDRVQIVGGDPWTPPWVKPWDLARSDNPHIALWGPWQMLPWIVLIGCLVWLTMRVLKERAKDAGAGSA